MTKPRKYLGFQMPPSIKSPLLYRLSYASGSRGHAGFFSITLGFALARNKVVD